MRARILITLALGLACLPLASQEEWTTFQFEAYNREFVNVRSSSEWVQDGAIKMKIRSPAHRLVIRDHELALRPDGEGHFQTRIRVAFSGEGDLEADLSLVGADKRIEDHVNVPSQEVEVLAVLRFSRVEGGYEVETIELPEKVDVAIESRLGSQLVDVCSGALAILGVKCSGLAAAFSIASIPLPGAGGTYFIDQDQLTRSERRRLDRFLSRNEAGKR
jgi:hypothetical protein